MSFFTIGIKFSVEYFLIFHVSVKYFYFKKPGGSPALKLVTLTNEAEYFRKNFLGFSTCSLPAVPVTLSMLKSILSRQT